MTDKLAKARPVYVAAPTNCSTPSAGGSGGGNQHLNGNIFNLSWDDETDNVNLYVQKGNAWLYGGRKNEPSIGSWSDLRSGPLSKRTKSEIATIRRPGVYKIYGHFVSSRQKRNAVKVRLQVSSSAGSKFSQAFEFNLPAGQRSPKSGGVAPLKEIEVLPDGTIRILR